MEICSRFTGMERKDGAFLLHTDNADIKVCFVTDEIVRVRASFDHELAEESYILMTTAWKDRMDDLFQGERTRVEPFAAEVTEDEKQVTFAAGKVTLVVDKDPINFRLLSADGTELYSTLPGNPFVKDSNNRVVAYSRMKEDDCFYGFGEKSGLLDKNKTFQRERTTDAMGYDAEKMDTLYKHIPFYIRLDRETRKDHSTYGVGKWWGGDGAFWDFTKPEGRTAWKKYLTESIIDVGTDSVWNDNCEYDSLMDKDCVCDFDGKGGTIGQLKPIMSTLMCKVGADIGGFAGPAPTEELFVRWVQQGIFQARFSIHSASNDNTVTEPWMFRDSADIIRNAILLRYRFTPYLYSAEYNASQTGAPIMRALVYDFQNDPNVYEESFEFLFGRDILVTNVIEEGAKTRKVYLPAGCKWYDINDNLREYEGGQTIEVPVTLASIPMFLRGSAIVVTTEDVKHILKDTMRQVDLLVSAESGWYYNLSDRTIWAKFNKPAKKDFTVTVSTEKFDLIGMAED